jgi:hypothetical protein
MIDIHKKIEQVQIIKSKRVDNNSSIAMIGGGDSIRNELQPEAILEIQGHKQTVVDNCKLIYCPLF